MNGMKIFWHSCLVILFLLFISESVYAVGQKKKNHPSGMHSYEQIEFVKQAIRQKKEPYITAYAQLLGRAEEVLQYKSHALADFSVPGYYRDPEGHVRNAEALRADVFTAYASALAYALSGEKKYGEHARYILNEWARINTKYSEYDGSLAMCCSGGGFVIAAGLLDGYPGWTKQDRQQFEKWTVNVLQKAANEIRERKNNWADWGRFASILCANYLNDDAEVAENMCLIKSDLFHKIGDDGSMPEETRRGANGLWYTYFSLAPMTAACWVGYLRTGDNIFVLEQDGKSIKKALNYLFYYNQRVDEWAWFDGKMNQGRPISDPDRPLIVTFWPANLLEAMGGLYGDQEYIDYVKSHRPVCYSNHHYAWTFPTLMPLWFD